MEIQESQELKQKIFSLLKNINNPHIHSLHIVGSHVDLNKPFENINDLDVLILTKEPITKYIYESLTVALQEIASHCESEEMHFVVERRHGNVKQKPLKKTNIQLHQLTFFYEKFISSVPENLAFHNWIISSRCLLGKPLSESVELKPVSKEHFLSDRDSIIFFITIIRSKKNSVAVYDERNGVFKRWVKEYENTDTQQLELLFVALNESAGNILKFITQKNKLFSYEERLLFWEEQNLLARKLMEKLLDIKYSIRNGVSFEYNLPELEAQTIKFLEFIQKKYLK